MKPAKRSLLLLNAVVLVFAATSAGQEPSEPFSHPPTSFSAEDAKFPDAVPLSSCARVSLAADVHVASLLKHQNLTAEELPEEWFTASQQSLGTGAGDLMVVMGASLMRGANISPFWILRIRKSSCSLLLSAGGHDLMVLRHKSNGIPDIKTFAITVATTSERLYRFDGHQYRLVRSRSYPNGS